MPQMLGFGPIFSRSLEATIAPNLQVPDDVHCFQLSHRVSLWPRGGWGVQQKQPDYLLSHTPMGHRPDELVMTRYSLFIIHDSRSSIHYALLIILQGGKHDENQNKKEDSNNKMKY